MEPSRSRSFIFRAPDTWNGNRDRSTVSRILVAMSGGVDSSLAAALLVEAGHEVVGATLRTFCYTAGPAHARTCCGLEGIQDAKAVAHSLGIPHTVFDVEEEFTRDVIDDFDDEYAHGRTPNPCVRCNSFTKFRDLLREARRLGADRIATGHYVRLEHEPDGSARLLRGADRVKDQAYFLWALPRTSLPFLDFPLGDLAKNQVRALARERGLVTADKPESQEICFVPTGDYRDLLSRRLQATHPALQPGEFVTTNGKPLGRHGGYAGFTVGQRKGLPGGSPEAMFVVAIRPDRREVVVGGRDDLLADGLELDRVNWLADAPREGERVMAQLRHRGPAVPAIVESAGRRTALRFPDPRSAVTPGQSCVLFQEDLMLGGGRIARTSRARIST
jgi:tRNA-specific 2-thiouridylase